MRKDNNDDEYFRRVLCKKMVTSSGAVYRSCKEGGSDHD